MAVAAAPYSTASQFFNEQREGGYPWRAAMVKAINLCYTIQNATAAERAHMTVAWLTNQMNQNPCHGVLWNTVGKCFAETGVYNVPTGVNNIKVGIIAYSNTNGSPTLLVAFPGMNFLNLPDDISAIKMTLTFLPLVGRIFRKSIGHSVDNQHLPKIKGPSGFVDVADTAISKFNIFHVINSVLQMQGAPPTTRIIFSGHSLGGVIASLLAFRYFAQYGEHNQSPNCNYWHNNGRIITITFGQPRTIFSKYVDLFNHIFGKGNYLRVVTTNTQGFRDWIAGFGSEYPNDTDAFGCRHAGIERAVPTGNNVTKFGLHNFSKYAAALPQLGQIQAPPQAHIAYQEPAEPSGSIMNAPSGPFDGFRPEEILSQCEIPTIRPGNEMLCFPTGTDIFFLSNQDIVLGVLQRTVDGWQYGEVENISGAVHQYYPDRFLGTPNTFYCAGSSTGGRRDKIWCIPLGSFDPRSITKLDAGGEPLSLGFDSGGNLIATVFCTREFDGIQGIAIQSINVATRERTRLFPEATAREGDIVAAGLLSGDRIYIVRNQKLQIFDRATGECRQSFPTPTLSCSYQFPFLENEHGLIITTGEHGRTYFIHFNTGRITELGGNPHDSYTRSVRVLTSGDLAGFTHHTDKRKVTVCQYFTIWDEETLNAKLSIKVDMKEDPHREYVRFCEVEDGLILLVTASGRFDLLDTKCADATSPIIWSRMGNFGSCDTSHPDTPHLGHRIALFPRGDHTVVFQRDNQFWHICYPNPRPPQEGAE